MPYQNPYAANSNPYAAPARANPMYGAYTEAAAGQPGVTGAQMGYGDPPPQAQPGVGQRVAQPLPGAAYGAPGTYANNGQRRQDPGYYTSGQQPTDAEKRAYPLKWYDPNTGMPQFDTVSGKVGGPAAAYLNELYRPSAAAAGTQAMVSNYIGQNLGAGPRTLPGQANLDAAAQNLAGQGVRVQGQQDALVNEALNRGVAERGVQTALAQQGVQDMANAGDQRALAQMLMQQAAGNGPSAAQGVLQQSLAANVGQMGGLAAQTRGSNAAAAIRAASQAGQQLGLQTNAQVSALRAQEQQAAAQAAGQVLAQGRQGDVARYGVQGDVANAARGQSLAEAMGAGGLMGQARGQDIDAANALVGAYQGNTNLGLQGQGLDDAQQRALLGAGLDLGNQQLQGGVADNGMFLNAYQAMADYILQNTQRTADTKRGQFATMDPYQQAVAIQNYQGNSGGGALMRAYGGGTH